MRWQSRVTRRTLLANTAVGTVGLAAGAIGAYAQPASKPPIKIVVTSGMLKISEDDLPSGSRFLPKPSSASEIVGTLRELTGGV
jgi:hypothetical protein